MTSNDDSEAIAGTDVGEQPKSHAVEFSLIGALIIVSIINVILAHTL